jgi:hypothetical protein
MLPGVSPDYCRGAMEHLNVCGSWPLHIPALGFTGMVQPGLPITLWTGEGVTCLEDSVMITELVLFS